MYKGDEIITQLPGRESLYHQDFYLWIETICKTIQDGKFNLVDWENVLEELESLGRQEKHQLENRCVVLLEHLLKLAYWETEREYNQRGWKGTIREQRQRILRLLKQSPSLKSYLSEVFPQCYLEARNIVIDKTGLSADVFPLEPMFTLEQALDENWLPESLD